MNKIEVLSPVGSPESLIAAVRSGADAIYLGAKSFSARRNAVNFNDEELAETIAYCHVRGVKVYVTVNIMLKENEMADAISLIAYLNRINTDAIIVQDLGLARLIHENFPQLPIHGSTQMSVSSKSALPILKEMGFERIVVAREMSKQQLIEFCDEAKKYNMEVEHFVHGALCMSVSGQCLLSAMIGSRSGNRGLCAQACRLPFKVQNGTGYDLSLKDASLFKAVKELQQIGITSLKIEGRMKRPEYISMATKCCRDAVDGKDYDDSLLKNVFSRSGFTDGYYQHKLGRNMFGTRTKEDVDASTDSFNKIHENYRVERQSIPISISASIKKNEPILLQVNDGENDVIIQGDKPLEANSSATEKKEIEEGLAKLGNTPFYLKQCHIELEENLFVRNSIVKNLRRQAIDSLAVKRSELKKRIEKDVEYANNDSTHQLNEIYLRISHLNQLPSNLEHIAGVIVPIDEEIDYLEYPMIVEIPRWIHSESYIDKRLSYFSSIGCKKAYCNSLAAITLARKYDMEVMGGNFLNIGNSQSAETLRRLDTSYITASAELSIEEINAIKTPLSKGVIGYGRIPLMLLVNCPLKNGRDCQKCDKKGYITDRKGINFPIRCQLSVSELLNSTPIYLADKLEDFNNLDYMILYFTIESKDEVSKIVEAYQNETKILKDYTRGLYYRSVL